MKHRNYYEILEIPTNATAEEIKRAYYSLCKKYHPDINPNTANLFKNINEAYETLIDTKKRKKYDSTLHIDPKDSKYNDFTSNYYSRAEYYQNLDKEPIIKLLLKFFDYRFENIAKSLWNRYLIVLVVTALFCFGVFILSTINGIVRLVLNKSIVSDIPHKTVSYNLNTFLNLVGEAKVFRSMWWVSFMGIFTITKTISLIARGIYWIFAHIIKPMLIPMAILFAALFLSNNQNQRDNYFKRY